MEFLITHDGGDTAAVGDDVLVDLEKINGAVLFHGALVNRMTSHLFHASMDTDGDFDAGGFREYLRYQLEAAQDTAVPGEPRDYLYELSEIRDESVWLMRNEVAGWTAMFASDY